MRSWLRSCRSSAIVDPTPHLVCQLRDLRFLGFQTLGSQTLAVLLELHHVQIQRQHSFAFFSHRPYEVQIYFYFFSASSRVTSKFSRIFCSNSTEWTYFCNPYKVYCIDIHIFGFLPWIRSNWHYRCPMQFWKCPREQGILVTKQCVLGNILILPVAPIAWSGFHMIAHKFYSIDRIEQSSIWAITIARQLCVTVSL